MRPLGALVATAALSASAHPQDVLPNPRVLQVGDVAEGEIDVESPVVRTPTLDRTYRDAPVRGLSYSLAAEAGAITIELRSSFFDAYLVVRDDDGKLLAEDDDSLIWTHARVVLKPEARTKVEILACALHGGVGRFELRANAGPPKPLPTAERSAAELAEAQRDVEVRTQELGEEHPATATSLESLGVLWQRRGRYREAGQAYERALRIREKAFGPEHEAVASILNDLGVLREYEGDYERARPLLERALAIAEKALGPDHSRTALYLDNLGLADDALGRFDDAQPRMERALKIREATLGPAHPHTAMNLNSLALVLEHKGRYAEAKQFLERALAIQEKDPGPDHPDTATTLNNLAILLEDEGRNDAARRCHERALKIREKALGDENPDTMFSLNGLAWVLAFEGRWEEARPLVERALSIRERVLGPTHPETARSLADLADMLERQDRLDEARPLLERALRIREAAQGRNHPETAKCLVQLAHLLQRQGKHSEARPLAERALAICESALGREHPDTADSLEDLAILLQEEGKEAEARPQFERALAIYVKALGPEHPSTATAIQNLASLFEREGDYERARALYERALDVDLKSLGPSHRNTSKTAAGLARCRLNLGERKEARAEAASDFATQWAHAREQARQASGSDALLTFARVRGALDLLLSTVDAAQRGADEPYAAALSVKSQVFEILESRRRALEEAKDPQLVATIERLQSVRAAMSNLFSLREIPDRPQHERDVERLRKERVDLERTLARLVLTSRDAKPPTPGELRASLPADAVSIDFLEHSLYEPARFKDGRLESLGRQGPPRLGAWISRAGAAAAAYVDLGPSAAIESAVRDWLGDVVLVRGAAPVPSTSRHVELAERLRSLVWDPLAPHVGEAKRVILSPDGPLTTLPLGIVEDGAGHALLEEHAFVLVEEMAAFSRPPPRQAPRSTAPASSPSLLVAGAVDYDTGDAAPESVRMGADLRGSFTRIWDPLSETRREVDGISARHRRQFPDARRLSLMESDATEERLKMELPGFDEIHLATHGYFLVDGLKSITETLRGEEERRSMDTLEHQLVAGYWPQFLCGIVCAGANHPQPERDNGLLTGDEVSGLDLSHCDLVVLSACETALGKRQAGEGMLSLTRSFREAGARTVISSLWQVRDDSTKELMLDFYDRLWSLHETKLDALRGAQLDMLKRNREKLGDTKPATWGAFVLTGEAE